MDFDSLKPEWRIFAERYVYDWNATKAYLKAYPEAAKNTAGANGHKLLKKAEIQAYIEHIQKDLKKLAGISALSQAQALMEIALKEGARDADKIKAREVINKMLGLNEPEKTENININVEPPEIKFFGDEQENEDN